MPGRGLRFLFLGWAFAWAAAAHAGPTRVVTLMPSLGEIAYDLIDEPNTRIVGVSEYTDYPPPLKGKPSIGPYFKVNLEKIVSLKPDLVLASTNGNAKDQIDHLRELKLNVVVVDTKSFADISKSMRAIGKAVGHEDRGDRMAKRFEKGVAEFKKKAVGRPSRKVLLQLSDNPLVVVGGPTFLTEALTTIGARNLYGDSTLEYPRPSREDVLKRAPDLILVLSMGEDQASFERMKKGWKKAEILRADELTIPTERLLLGIARLEEAVYGKH